MATSDPDSSETSVKPRRTRALHEDETYWTRILIDAGRMSFPTSTPSSKAPMDTQTGSPTTFPSSSPTTERPTAAPSGPLLPSNSPSTSFPSSSPTTERPTSAPSGPLLPSNSPSSSQTFHPSTNPSALPTALLSARPSMDPSSEPSDIPSDDPSANPTLLPSSGPTASPSNGPSAASSTSRPSSAPTPSPTKKESVSPTSDPSLVPTLSPTNVSSVPPTSSPTSILTATPTLVPTSSPSQQPISFPTSSPSLTPTLTPECELLLSIECIADNGTQCEDYFPEPEVCQQAPSRLVMQYNGGTCEQSATTQPPSLFQCFDFGGGPPLEGEVYIEATDARGMGLSYFAGNVPLGGTYTMTNQGNPLLSETSFIIYAFEGGPPRQVVNFNTGCFRNLYLKDRYGASQVVEWTNDEQGTVNCVKNVTYNYRTENAVSVVAQLLSLVSTINDERVNLTESVENSVIEPGDTLLVDFKTEIDFTNRMPYVVAANVTGQNLGRQCMASEQIQFEAGSPLSPNVPTRGTVPPSASPAPNPDPEEQTCDLTATVECKLKNGVPCSVLSTIQEEDRTCSGMPAMLGWFYRGGNCTGTTNQTIICVDTNTGSSSEAEVYLEIRATDGGQRYFDGIVSEGDLVVIRGSSDDGLEDSVTVLVTTNDANNTVLQTVTFSIACQQSDDLTIGKTFGALELAEYQTDIMIVQGYEEVRWEYSVANTGDLETIILSLEAIQNGEGLELTRLIPAGDEVLRSGRGITVIVKDLLGLVSPGVYQSRMAVSAQVIGGLSCNVEDLTTFSVL